MKQLAVTIVLILGACSSAPPLLAPGVACQVGAPCASASTEQCTCSCNRCGCSAGQLVSVTLVLCTDGGTGDAGH